MKTVKEVSRLAGVSIRTLRYYDEIGLLKPKRISENQYRLYDDKALEKLQEIMDDYKKEGKSVYTKTFIEDNEEKVKALQAEYEFTYTIEER